MSTKKNENVKGSTAVAVVGNAGVPEVLSLLDQKINSLKHITDSVYRTTGQLQGFGDIKSETKIENLIRAFSMVRGKSDAYASAAKELGLTTVPAFSVDGGNVDDWKQDIILRINIISHKEQLDKLTEYKNKMSKFLSEADQKEILMKEMAAFLGAE